MENTGGFAAGTLVHTDKGLLPIEQIKVGDMVFSKPESGEGELAYKRVTQTFITENQPIWATIAAIELEKDGALTGALKEEFLFTTANHPFWGLDTPDHTKGRWVSICDIEMGGFSTSFSGQDVCLVENLELYQTIKSNKAFYMIRPDSFGGIVLDVDLYKNNTLGVPDYFSDKFLIEANWDENEDPIFDPYLTTVYNFELEDYHTYFVGELGVWVHNTCNINK